ncbi:MAG TPA: hypothetical protein VFV43_04305 [Limnobacter sp.]|nr:hypothetical protein [Limnobacter sp.]
MSKHITRIMILAVGLFGLTLGVASAVNAQVMVIASDNSPINEIELRELRSLYKGRLTRLRGQSVVPLNTAPGSTDRRAFLDQMMEQNELDYVGYWHVRRYSGQGVPPEEVGTHDELFDKLRKNNGLIGYIWIEPGKKPDLPTGLKIIKVK